MKSSLFALALMALIAPTSVRAAVILVPDGGFESPQIPTNSYQYNPTGALWSFTGTSGEINGSSAFGNPSPPEGSQIAFLQTNSAQPTSSGTGVIGSISQTFTLATSGLYQLNFLDASRAGFAQSSFSVAVDGVTVASVSPASTSFALFTTNTLNLAAGATTITFTSTGPTDSTSFLDNIYFTTTAVAVPEPASLAMLGMGLVAVGGFAAKKSRRNRA